MFRQILNRVNPVAAPLAALSDDDRLAVMQRRALYAQDRRSYQISQSYQYTVNGLPLRIRYLKRRVQDLMILSESAIPSRAIRLIRNYIQSLPWAIQVKAEGKMTDPLKKSAEKVETVLNRPNGSDISFARFIGQIVEDLLMFDAGVWEYVSKPSNGNKILGLEVVPGYSIATLLKWDGDTKSDRWAQLDAGGNPIVRFADRDMEYLIQRKRSYTPHGTSQLETMVEIMDAWLKLARYRSNVASEAYPAFALYMGEEFDDIASTEFRAYWNAQVQGRGTPFYFGGYGKEPPAVLNLKPVGDEGLYIKYEEALVRVASFCFDLKPLDFSMERDVNRSTAQHQGSASVREAGLPMATLVADHLNNRVLPRIAEETGDSNIQKLLFFWLGLDAKDEQAVASVHQIYLANDVVKIDEVRSDLDLPPLDNGIGDMTLTAYRSLVGIQVPADMQQPGGDGGNPDNPGGNVPPRRDGGDGGDGGDGRDTGGL